MPQGVERQQLDWGKRVKQLYEGRTTLVRPLVFSSTVPKEFPTA